MHGENSDNCLYFYNWESPVSQNSDSEGCSANDILYAFKITWEEVFLSKTTEHLWSLRKCF